jgi:hypothetical protein
LDFDLVGRLIRAEIERRGDRRLTILHRRIDVIEIGRTRDRVFDRLDDRIANLRRRSARVRKPHLHDRKIDVRKLLLDDRAKRERPREQDEREHDDDERRPANEELR